MAEMDTSSGGGHKKGPGVKKGKKLSTRVDLTPMVDLGFLLITFFIFTTTMSQPTAMPLNLPKDVDKPDEQNKVKESAVLTIMLGKNNQIYYYEGMDPTKLQSTSFKGVRDIVLDKKRRTDPADFVVILKPDQDATYGDVVNIVDEMKIDDVKRFAQVDISPMEYSLVQRTEQANGIH
ncbi:MAG TPA: biopolymer transporter ExbD [Puia sp.]|nr:biopolymer transporter ExbD [Puia sp.]